MVASQAHRVGVEADQLVIPAFLALPVSAAVLDRAGVIVAVNRQWDQFASTNGADPSRTGPGQSYLSACSAAAEDRYAAEASEGLRRVLEGKAPCFQLEYPCHSPTERRWFLMWAAPLPAGDKTGGAVVAHMDITRRWEAERALADRVAALERSNDDLTAFGRIVAHDLKEPLRGMGAYASFVLEDAPDLSPDLRGKLEKIVRLAKRTATALDGLLHFAQVGMQAMEPEPVNLGELASEVLDSFGPQFEAAGAVGRVVSPLPSVRCDRHLVAEAMANLVGNALKYNDKPQKTVEIGALPSGFYVRDNGIGMAPAARSRVFDVFTRLHAKDEFGGGEGLGLSIVKRVAERHHGAVWIESSLGQGSTFFVTLGDAEGGGRPRTPPHERGGGGGQEEWGPKRN